MNAPVKASSTIPFDTARLDRLMDEAGIDVLIATSKHNVQYLLGGHRAFFFDYMDAMGLSRYLPVAGLRQRRAGQGRLFRAPAGELPAREQSVLDAGAACATTPARSTPCRRRSSTSARRASRRAASAPRLSFLPVDAGKALQSAFSGSTLITDALFVLERMRAIKTPEELKKLKVASEAVLELHEGGDRQSRPGRHQGGADRGAAPRGDQPRARPSNIA